MKASEAWVLPENLLAVEKRLHDRPSGASPEPFGHAGAYLAYRTGLDGKLIRSHALADDGKGLAYVRSLSETLALMGHRIGSAILDVGCGVGTITDALRRSVPGAEVSGMDLSSDAVLAAQERYPRCRFIRRSADELSLVPDASLDLIHAREFYPFTRTEDPGFHLRFLRAFAPKLRPGGLIILGPGYLAANAVADDLGLKKWWREPEIVGQARAKGIL